ncbi:MAG: branched-chain amino acid ABC transporter permease [Acidobacteria bacterium]|nr:branched-chain amino acid ABC transporter permease [Acidobacteriota bacterium]
MRKWILWLLALAALAGLQLTLKGLIGAYNYQIVILVGINIILAVSLNLINGVTGQFSIGHAGFYAVGAYTSASVVYYGGPWIRAAAAFLPPLAQDAFLLVLGMFAAAIAAGLAGLAVGIPSLRLRGDYLAIVTLGFGEIIRVLILNIDFIGGSRGFSGIPQLSNFFWVYLAVLITIISIHNLVNSSYGRAFISIRDDEIAAEAMGVDTTRIKVLSFVISSMFAGVAGSLFGHYTMYLHPNSFLFITSFYIIIMIVVGGLGSIEGAVLGAILITVVLEVFREFGAFRLVNFSILLVLIMLYRPQGLLGTWTVSKKRQNAAVAK